MNVSRSPSNDDVFLSLYSFGAMVGLGICILLFAGLVDPKCCRMCSSWVCFIDQRTGFHSIHCRHRYIYIYIDLCLYIYVYINVYLHSRLTPSIALIIYPHSMTNR